MTSFAVLWILILSVSVRSDTDGPGKSGIGDLRKGVGGEGEKVAMGYSDSWVVEFDGGKKEADALAERHGFVNLGQVRIF